jgi:hypothetical protein
MGRPLRMTRGSALLCVTAIAALSAAACSGGQSNSTTADPPASSSHASKPFSLEQIAAKTACRIQLQGNASELRQGSCQTSKGRFVVMTFSTEQAGADWLKEAKNWGGTYLVGTRWVIVGTPQQLKSFRDQLGGNIEAGDDHSAAGHNHTSQPG